jgi:hypothetical protein
VGIIDVVIILRVHEHIVAVGVMFTVIANQHQLVKQQLPPILESVVESVHTIHDTIHAVAAD